MTDQHRYTEPGEYVAICNKTNWDGHYVKRFTFPEEVADGTVAASWYFLNRIDFSACLEAVYPLEIFENVLHAEAFRAQLEKMCNKGIWVFTDAPVGRVGLTTDKASARLSVKEGPKGGQLYRRTISGIDLKEG